MGEPLDKFGFAKKIGREPALILFLDGGIQFLCEPDQFGGVVVDLPLALEVGGVEVLFRRLFLVHLHLGVAVGKLVSGRDRIRLLDVLRRLACLLRRER